MLEKENTKSSSQILQVKETEGVIPPFLLKYTQQRLLFQKP